GIRAIDPRAVTNAVESGEVRTGFGRRDNIVGGGGIVGVRQAYFDSFSAKLLELLHGSLDGVVYLRVEATDHIFPGDSDFQAFDIPIECAGIIRHWFRNAGRIERIDPADGFEQSRGVANILCEGADLVERRGEGDQAVARNASVGRFKSDTSTERGRL